MSKARMVSLAQVGLAAGPHEAAVEVEVVGMRRVELGAKRDAEIAAGAPVHLAQEFGFLAFALPVLKEIERPAEPCAFC